MPRNPDKKRCGAKRRDGKPCQRWAVKGRTRCKLHGGGSPAKERAGQAKPPGRPATHGLYSVRERRNLAQAIQELRGDVLVMDLDEEIAFCKLRLRDLLNQATSWDDPSFYVTTAKGVHDVVGELLDRIARLVERRHKIVSSDKYLMTVDQVEPMLRAVDKVIDEFVEETDREAARESLAERFEGIFLPLAAG